MTYIYLHTCLSTGVGYVGKTLLSIEERWKQHCRAAALGSRTRFHTAIRKYGANDWRHAELEACATPEAAVSAEKAWIKFLGKAARYNSTHGSARANRIRLEAYEAALIRRLVRDLDAKRVMRRLRLEDRRTLKKAAARQWLHPLTVANIRIQLAGWPLAR